MPSLKLCCEHLPEFEGVSHSSIISESLTGDEPLPMASSVTIRVDDTETEKETEKGNGHVSFAHFIRYLWLYVLC